MVSQMKSRLFKFGVWLTLSVSLTACLKTKMSREEWTDLQDECRKYAKAQAVEASREGVNATEHELYTRCVKESLDSPQTLGDLRDKLKGSP